MPTKTSDGQGHDKSKLQERTEDSITSILDPAPESDDESLALDDEEPPPSKDEVEKLVKSRDTFLTHIETRHRPQPRTQLPILVQSDPEDGDADDENEAEEDGSEESGSEEGEIAEVHSKQITEHENASLTRYQVAEIYNIHVAENNKIIKGLIKTTHAERIFEQDSLIAFFNHLDLHLEYEKFQDQRRKDLGVPFTSKCSESD